MNAVGPRPIRGPHAYNDERRPWRFNPPATVFSIPHTSQCGGAEPRVAVQKGARSANGAYEWWRLGSHWAKGALGWNSKTEF
jgi:hypothetical protein